MKHGKNPFKHDDETMSRCPLCGAAKAVSMIPDAAMVVIGTEECSYYTKSTLDMRGGGENCFSVVLNQHDVTFGCVDKVEVALHELMEEYHPKSIFLITTCVVEITGDDFTALAEEIAQQHQIPVKIIQTNHFKGKDHDYGFELVQKEAATFTKAPSKMGGILGKLGGKLSGKSRGGNPHGGRGQGMSEEQMMERMRRKMGGSMSEDEMRAMLRQKMGGRL